MQVGLALEFAPVLDAAKSQITHLRRSHEDLSLPMNAYKAIVAAMNDAAAHNPVTTLTLTFCKSAQALCKLLASTDSQQYMALHSAITALLSAARLHDTTQPSHNNCANQAEQCLGPCAKSVILVLGHTAQSMTLSGTGLQPQPDTEQAPYAPSAAKHQPAVTSSAQPSQPSAAIPTAIASVNSTADQQQGAAAADVKQQHESRLQLWPWLLRAAAALDWMEAVQVGEALSACAAQVGNTGKLAPPGNGTSPGNGAPPDKTSASSGHVNQFGQSASCPSTANHHQQELKYVVGGCVLYK